jgi:hypothetical protein
VGRPNKIRRLPPSLREQLNRMLDDGHSLDEIVTHLRKLGADVSRSGVGRYKVKQDKVAERVRQSKEAAEALVSKLGAGADEGRMGRALTQIVQTLAFDYINRRAEDPEAQVELDEIYQMARIIRQAGLAGKAGQDHELKTREVVREDAADESGEAGPAATEWDGENENSA